MNLFNVYPLQDIQPMKASGCYVYDDKGERYLDFYGGHAVISIGHSHPHYISRISAQLENIGFYSNAVKNPLQKELAAKLGKASGYEDYQLFLCNSGAEANENALKLASFHTGRKKIISFKHAFHGRTSLAVSATDNPKVSAPVNLTDNIIFHHFGDIEGVQQSLASQEVAAIIIEGIQGVAGIHVACTTFLQELAKMCRATGTLLILDEVQSGYGRTGGFFAHQAAGITPDIITIAKGMGNGFPIGGVLIHPDIAPWFGMLGTTFGGNHLACAAGLAVLEVIEQENLIAHAAAMGKLITEALSDIDDITTIKGRGLMLGLAFDFPIKDLRNHLLYEGRIFTGNAADPKVLRLLPPLNIGSEEVQVFVQQLTASLNQVKESSQ